MVVVESRVAICVERFHSTVYNMFVCFIRYRFRPRVLRDVSHVNLRVQLLGEWVESPVAVAPTGLQKMAHEDGELAVAQG